jgi:hypothetical protein
LTSRLASSGIPAFAGMTEAAMPRRRRSGIPAFAGMTESRNPAPPKKRDTGFRRNDESCDVRARKIGLVFTAEMLRRSAAHVGRDITCAFA